MKLYTLASMFRILGATFLVLMITRASSQEVLFINTSVGELVQITPELCEAVVVGITSTLLQDIAFTPDGRLWGVYGNSLYEIDPIDAATTFVGTMPGLSTNSLVAWNNDTLIGDYYGWLWGIRTSDAYAWQIDSIGVGSSGDLTWYNGDLYMTTFVPDMVRLTVNADLTSVTSVVHVGVLESGWGGGWLGVNTLIMESGCGQSSRMLACVGPNVLEVSAFDASITPVCPDVISGVSWGAASYAEFPDVVTSSAIPVLIPNVFSPNGDGVNDQLQPSPPDVVQYWTCTIYDRWANLIQICNAQGWDGRDANGRPCSEGTYFIEAQVNSHCNAKVVVHSHVTLFR